VRDASGLDAPLDKQGLAVRDASGLDKK